MIVTRIDPESRSTIAAADGYHALGRGDTVLARQKFTEAGEILEAGAAQTTSLPEKNLLRFLAASQYYHGGDYQRARRVVRRTRPKYLSESDQGKFEAFRKDVEERADAGYARRIREAVVGCWKKRQADEAIRLLQRHPYVLERGTLAWCRADLCWMAGRWHAAALFYSDAIRFSGFQPKMVFLKAASVLRLNTDERFDEACEFASRVVASNPTALDLVAVCGVRVSQLLKGDRPAGQEAIALCQQAEQEFSRLPMQVQSDPDARAFMSHGYMLAALAADRLGDRSRALAIVSSGLAFGPNGPDAGHFRSVLSDPDRWFGQPAEQIAATPAGLVASMREREASQESFLRAA